jgi:chemotaxis methyl-accepting protein methylase
MPEDEVDLFLAFAQNEYRLDLSFYRKTFLGRRINVRMDAVEVNNLTEYLNLLKKDTQEWKKFLDNLSINVSEFFRDPEVFSYFKDNCLPGIFKNKEETGFKRIHCWSCGCSCGEETYSLAIMFREYSGRKNRDFFIKVSGTDVDQDALTKAKEAKYRQQSLGKVTPVILEKYFDNLGNDIYQVKKEIRESVDFKTHNLLTDNLIPNVDIIFFRNVRIYFNENKAGKILLKIYESLRKNGYLVLGKVETLGSLKNLFEPVSINNKIFRKI